MNRLVSRWQAGTVVVSMMVLGGCATTPGSDVATACPTTKIAVPSDRIGHSDDQGRIRYVVTMERLITSCQIVDGHVDVDLAFDLKAERGPVFDDRPMKLDYYVATVDPRREIVDKQVLGVELTLAPAQTESVVREELTLRLPISDDASGANYNLYLGFQPERRS